MCADAVARIASGGVTHILSSWIWKMQLINLNYENNAKGHSPEDFFFPFFFSSLPLHPFFFFPPFCFSVKTLPLLQEMYALPGGFQGKLPYLRHLLWSENPSQLQLWPEAQEQQWAGFAMQAGTVLGSFLRAASGHWPSRASCKAHLFPSWKWKNDLKGKSRD